MTVSSNPRCCALCASLISDENDSREHILPNAIGGRRRLSGFICRHCNSASGQVWDSALCKQLAPLSTMLNIRRQRGKNRPAVVETLSGQELELLSNGSLNLRRPDLVRKAEGGSTSVEVRARSMEEANSIAEGIKARYPGAEIQRPATRSTKYVEEPVGFLLQFGGEHAGRSIVKSCLALAYEAGLSIDDCEHAKEYLLSDGEPCFGYYNDADLVLNRPDAAFLHCVFVCGDPTSGQVLGYVEYFGHRRLVLCLSSSFSGTAFSRCYAVDPVSGRELTVQIELPFGPEDVKSIYACEKFDSEKLAEAIGRLVEDYQQRARTAMLERATASAVEFALANCGAEDGEVLTEAHFVVISRLVAERLGPVLAYLLGRGRFSEAELREIRERLHEDESIDQ